jgi:trehalose/maltose hydrolase-like predicted phosphorylase
VDNTGYNTLRNDPAVSLNRFVLRQSQEAQERTHVLHVLTGTGCGGADLAGQLRRSIMSQLSRDPTPAAVAQALVARNAEAWAERWATDIVLVPKSDATAAERDDVRQVRRALRYAMYNLHACSRPGSVVDLEGTVAQGAQDAFLVPAYVLMSPDVAVGSLDARFKGIDSAASAAAAFGLRGVKFQYEGDDTTGAGTALLWDADVPLRVFNTALAAVSTWNYYRVTRDRDWLMDRGYAVLRAVADMVCSATDLVAGQHRLRNVISMNDSDRPATDNALTVASALLALRFAIEASYELGYQPKPTWLTVRQGLRLPLDDVSGVLLQQAVVDQEHDVVGSSTHTASPTPTDRHTTRFCRVRLGGWLDSGKRAPCATQ